VREIAFAPEEGLVLTKTCDFVLSMELSEFALTFNGEEMELEETPEGTNGTEGHLVVVDTYDAVDSERATKLTRRFEEATRHTESTGPAGDNDEDKESPLQGMTVVFTYDGDEYAVAYGPDDEDGDEDLLEDLEAEIDFVALLPDREVEDGDSWTVDASEFGDLFAFGGDLHFDEEEDETMQRLINEALDDNLTGEFTCTFAGMRDLDGRSVAVIELAIEAEGDADDESTQDVGDSGFEVEVTSSAHGEIDLTGELLWDVEGGHFAALTLSGDLALATTEAGSGDFDGQSFEQEVSISFEGTVEFTFTVERD